MGEQEHKGVYQRVLKPRSRYLHFKTSIQFKNIKVKLLELEVNMLDDRTYPVLPLTKENYLWELDGSLTIDQHSFKNKDELTFYINADLFMKEHEFSILKINTIHVYQINKLNYKKENEELLKMIFIESVEHANLILKTSARNTAFEKFKIPFLKKRELNEWAEENNYRYIPQPKERENGDILPAMDNETRKQHIEKMNQLVKWIDDFDDRVDNLGLKEKSKEYWEKFAEWSRMNKIMWEHKMIARNNMVAHLIDMLERMRKARKKIPFTPFALAFYNGNKKFLQQVLKKEMKDFKNN